MPTTKLPWIRLAFSALNVLADFLIWALTAAAWTEEKCRDFSANREDFLDVLEGSMSFCKFGFVRLRILLDRRNRIGQFLPCAAGILTQRTFGNLGAVGASKILVVPSFRGVWVTWQ